MPAFREEPGLQQKDYLWDPATEEFSGVYVFCCRKALAAVRESELLQSLRAVYELAGPPRARVLEVRARLFDGT